MGGQQRSGAGMTFRIFYCEIRHASIILAPQGKTLQQGLMLSHSHEIPQPSEYSWWPPQVDPEYNSACLRGVWCDTQEKKRGLLSSVSQAQEAVDEALQHFDKSDAGRLQLKLIVTNAILPELARDPRWQDGVESLFPLNGCGDNFTRTSLLYLGFNRPERLAPIPQKGLENVMQALQEKPQPLSALLDRVPSDIEVRRVDAAEQSLVEQLAFLWQKFGFSAMEIQALLANGDNLIVGAFHDGRLVSAGRANFMRHTLNGVPFTLVEHTDAATLPELEGRGLYGAVLATQMRELAALPEPPNLLVGETNILSLPALKISRRVGREFGLEHTLRTGFSKGILRQDIAMTTDSGDVVFKDLVPAFISRERLLELTAPTR